MSPNVPLSSEGVIKWRLHLGRDPAKACPHTVQLRYEVGHYERWVCEACGDVRNRTCIHEFKWTDIVPPFIDEEGNPFTELLICKHCRMDGT